MQLIWKVTDKCIYIFIVSDTGAMIDSEPH